MGGKPGATRRGPRAAGESGGGRRSHPVVAVTPAAKTLTSRVVTEGQGSPDQTAGRSLRDGQRSMRRRRTRRTSPVTTRKRPVPIGSAAPVFGVDTAWTAPLGPVVMPSTPAAGVGVGVGVVAGVGVGVGVDVG